jgi:SAM-dependent methyltransferase
MKVFRSIKDVFDFRINSHIEYESRVASKNVVLDIGGQNQQSRSNKRLRQMSTNPKTRIVSTDIIADYNPDIVDDICNSKIESNSYDAVYCDAILEHVKDYAGAMNHIHRILKPGGELFIYVPFVWSIHDKMDYHRFTFAELDRILRIFSEHKIFLPDGNGYGGVLWLVLTSFKIYKFPKLWRLLSSCTNALLAIPLLLIYQLNLDQGNSKRQGISFTEFKFYCTHLYVNHGYCGWAVK